MPTTLTGLLLFVVLLLPGFAYLVGKERVGTERRTSPFRETVAVVSASVASELVVLTAAWLLNTYAWPGWSLSIEVGRLVADPGNYWQQRPGLLAAWGLGLLLAATLGTHLATRPRVRRLLPGSYPDPSTVSAWWMLFEHWKRGRPTYVGCVLDDGAYVAGEVRSFNNSADDVTDRDLILGAPVSYRARNARTTIDLQCSAVCIPAGRVVLLEVSYLPGQRPAQVPAPAAVAAGAAPPQLAAPTPRASDPASDHDHHHRDAERHEAQ